MFYIYIAISIFSREKYVVLFYNLTLRAFLSLSLSLSLSRRAASSYSLSLYNHTKKAHIKHALVLGPVFVYALCISAHNNSAFYTFDHWTCNYLMTPSVHSNTFILVKTIPFRPQTCPKMYTIAEILKSYTNINKGKSNSNSIHICTFSKELSRFRETSHHRPQTCPNLGKCTFAGIDEIANRYWPNRQPVLTK